MDLGLWKQAHQPYAQALGGSLAQLYIPRVPRVPGGDTQGASMSTNLFSPRLSPYYFRFLQFICSAPALMANLASC